MKKIIYISIFVIISSAVYSQPLNRLSNFIYNQQYYNPGAFGMYEQQFNLSLLNRFQWAGFKGAPMVSILWADYKLKENGLAFGVVLDRFSSGAARRIGASFNTSYGLLIGYNTRLSMGLRLGYDQIRFEPGNLTNVFDDGDDLATGIITRSFVKVGAGFLLQSKKFHLGFSSSDLYRNDPSHYFNPDTAGFISTPRNYVINTGYRLVLNDAYTLIPTGIFYAYTSSSMVGGAGLIFEIKDYFWAGSTYYKGIKGKGENSTNDFLSFTVGTHISSRVRFVYSYEIGFSNTLKSRLNTHELNLLVKMDKVFRKKVK